MLLKLSKEKVYCFLFVVRLYIRHQIVSTNAAGSKFIILIRSLLNGVLSMPKAALKAVAG